MHPRNAYANPPDFLTLARRYPPLRPHVFLTHTGPTIDFKSIPAQRLLTEALLYLDFDISLTLPNDRLCPPVPNRLNYVLWIQDIVKTFALGEEMVRGIDIGTGASVIYPLLACRLEPTWSFVATDIDKESLASARGNIERNHLSDRIALVDTSSNPYILQPLEGPLTFHFSMCNPPFYASLEEITQSTEAKEFGPSAVCTGAENEMVTSGGEASFVSRMVTESLRYGTRCRWYTSMLGKMSSLPLIVGLLREHQVDNYAITEFVQGQTRRWAIAWSFGTLRLPDSLARIANSTLQNVMPLRTTLCQRINNAISSVLFYGTLLRVLQAIDGVDVQPESEHINGRRIPSVVVTATDVTWTRSARRKKTSSQARMDVDPKSRRQEGVVMQCRVDCTCEDEPTLTMRDGQPSTSGCLFLVYQWVDGSNRGVFESFVNHVNRKVTSTVESEARTPLQAGM